MKEYRITVAEMFGNHIEEAFIGGTFKDAYDMAVRLAKAEKHYAAHKLPVVSFVWDGLDIIGSFTAAAGIYTYGNMKTSSSTIRKGFEGEYTL